MGSRPLHGEEVECTRTGHGLGAIRGAEFRQEMLDVEFDGVQAEDQVLGNLLVGETFGHQLEHIVLTVHSADSIGRRVWCWLRRGHRSWARATRGQSLPGCAEDSQARRW